MRSAYPQAERVHRYARDVVAGRIPAGWLVRAACQRHLDDLRRPDLVWRPQAAQAWLDFFESLHLDQGVPFRLMEHQAFKIGSLTGWHRPDGRRRFRTAYIEEGKANGKTPLAAGFALGALLLDSEPSPSIYLAAAAKAQAHICFEDVEKIVRATPRLARALEILRSTITMPARLGRITTLSAEDKGHHGLRVHLGVLDEIHAHGSAAMVKVITAGTKNCKNSLILLITNSGSDRTGPCWAYHERAVSCLEGKPDDELFAYLAALDPCPKCRARGKRQIDLKCPACDDWRDLEKLRKANPSLGGPFFDRDYLARRIALAQKMPSEINNVLQLNCCVWTEAAAGWLDMQAWRQLCHDPALRPDHFAGQPCWIGLDAANRVDCTVVVKIFERSPGSGTLDPASLGEAAKAAFAEAASPPPAAGDEPRPSPEGAEAGPVARLAAQGYAIFLTAYVPRALVQNSSHANAEAYLTWATQGRLVVTEGAITDFARIEADLRADAARFQVRRLQADPRELGYLLARVREWADFDVVEVGQGPALISAPMKMFEGLVAAGLMKHDGDPVLDWMLANIELKTTRGGGPVKYYYPTRPSPEKKIDAGPAAFMALDGALRQPPEPAAPSLVMLG